MVEKEAEKIRYFTSKSLDKKPEIVCNFLKTYWEELIKANQETSSENEVLIFPSRTRVMKASPFQRRNAYKHLHWLILDGVFSEQDNQLIPTSFIFEINGEIFNPSTFLFEETLPLELRKEQIYLVKPKIRTKKLVQLLEKIWLEGNCLRDYLNISLGLPEPYAHTQDYHYSELPKTLHMIDGWEQTNPKIAEQEQKLLNVISPIKDPLFHNTAFFLTSLSSSPFIQIDDVNKDYVLAAWCSRIVGDELKGCADDNATTNSVIEYYTLDKELIDRNNFVYGQDGLNLMSDLLVVSNRKTTSGNLLGWYDFKNNIPAGKRVHNHILISFVRIKMPPETAYFRIITGERSYFAFVSLFPHSKFPYDFFKQRLQHPEEFVQHSESIFYYKKCREISNPKGYLDMNKKLYQASFETGESKNELLKNALKDLNIFAFSLRQDIKKAIAKNIFSKEFLYIAISAFDARLLLSLAIRNKNESLKKKLILEIINDYHTALELISPIRKQDVLSEQVLLMIMTIFRQYRDVRFYLKQKMEMTHLRKVIQENRNLLDNSSNIELKIEIYRWLLNFERDTIEEQLMAGKDADMTEASSIFQALVTVYKELAEHVHNIGETNSKIMQNKYLFYRNQSLFFNFSDILFRAKVYARTTNDARIQYLLNSLKEFGEKLF